MPPQVSGYGQEIRRATVIIETDEFRVTVTGVQPLVRWNVQTDFVSISVQGWMQNMPVTGSAHLGLEMAPSPGHPLHVAYEDIPSRVMERHEPLGSDGLAEADTMSGVPGEAPSPRAGEGRGALPGGFDWLS